MGWVKNRPPNPISPIFFFPLSLLIRIGIFEIMFLAIIWRFCLQLFSLFVHLPLYAVLPLNYFILFFNFWVYEFFNWEFLFLNLLFVVRWVALRTGNWTMGEWDHDCEGSLLESRFIGKGLLLDFLLFVILFNCGCEEELNFSVWYPYGTQQFQTKLNSWEVSNGSRSSNLNVCIWFLPSLCQLWGSKVKICLS